jgi:hypothetical protein
MSKRSTRPSTPAWSVRWARSSPRWAPEGAEASLVADEIARIVALPAGQRPHRVTINPIDDGSEEVSDVADQIRREFLTRVGLADLLTVRQANS